MMADILLNSTWLSELICESVLCMCLVMETVSNEKLPDVTLPSFVDCGSPLLGPKGALQSMNPHASVNHNRQVDKKSMEDQVRSVPTEH